MGAMPPVFWKDPGELAWVVPGYDVVAVFPECSRSDSNEDESSGAFAGVVRSGIGSECRNAHNRRRPNRNPRRPLPHSRNNRKRKSRIPPNTTLMSARCSRHDPAAKISGLEAFLTQYPNSVMKEDALELLMGTYQQAGNQAKVIEPQTAAHGESGQRPRPGAAGVQRAGRAEVGRCQATRGTGIAGPAKCQSPKGVGRGFCQAEDPAGWAAE